MTNALKPFAPSLRVTAEDARQDGISLDMGDWFIQGLGNCLGAFVDLIGPPPGEEDAENINRWANIITTFPIATLAPEFFGWMFNRPAGSLDQYTEMDLQGGGSGSGPRPGSPLAKGKLRFINRPVQGDECEATQRRQLRLTLFLNPTRFVRHQQIPRALTGEPSRWVLPEPNLRTLPLRRRNQSATESRNADVETCLDGNDNVLIGNAALSFARPKAWPIHLRRYLIAVEDALHEEFRRAASAVHLTLNGPHGFARAPYYSLKKVETYFEFSSPNPTQLVRRLQPGLNAIGLGNTSRSYPHGQAESGTEAGNARQALINLRGGRKLRVYAKTTHRIRFEIIHDVTKKGVSDLLHAADGGYTTENRSELHDWFRLLAQDAATQLNQVLDTLESRLHVPADSADTYELLGEIFATVNNERRAKDLLALLVENGCLRIGRRGTDFLPEIRQLRRKGFLENVGGADNVTARYRAALDTLRRQAGLPALAGPVINCRERQRPSGASVQPVAPKAAK